MGHSQQGPCLEERRGLAGYELTPHKMELINGRLLWSRKDRETLLALLLENIGADRAVQLGEPDVWRSAVAKLPPRS